MKKLGVVVLAVVGLVCGCIGGVLALFVVISDPALACAVTPIDEVESIDTPTLGTLNREQIVNAAIIANVGAEVMANLDGKARERGQIIAVATAMQESGLINLGHLGNRNDHDSLGLFQQRPSQGWGTPEQVTDPRYASGKFYEKLLTIDGWEIMDLTDAAQKVQRSAYPNAYAKHETGATLVVSALSDGELSCKTYAGWVPPVIADVGDTFGAPRPKNRTHKGVDLRASRYTTIHAAAAGEVVVAGCDHGKVYDGDGNYVRDYHCNGEGSPTTTGCGWYVKIRHAGNIYTLYCHMEKPPLVNVNDYVTACTVLGVVGSTGGSSAPHLHFQVHVDGEFNDHAKDPEPFMEQHGAPLGTSASDEVKQRCEYGAN